MTQAIFFDLGGVLIDIEMDACLRAFREDLGFARITEILDPCHQKGVFGEMEAGRISADEFRAAVLAECRPGATPADVDRCIHALLGDFPPCKAELLKDLAERYDLYILSNNNPIAMARSHCIFEAAGLDWRRVFKAEFISCEMHLLKPGQEIYREAVRRAGCSAEEVVFVDDSPVNVEAARSVGIRSALYRPGDDLRATLERML